MSLENEMTEATAFSATDFVRIVKDIGSGEFDSQIIGRAALWQYLMALPDGTMLNGKISPSVASNNLTLALKTHAGADPSAADPVLIKINGTWRACSAALSFTIAAGANTFNAGSAELATKEIDCFAYGIWNTTPATDIVDLGAARIPYGTVYSDFSGTATAETYLAHANGSAPAAGDDVVVIGRFAATLSAGAGYTWTVPTFTTTNLIQRPIYETRWLEWIPTCAAVGGGSFDSPSITNAIYRCIGPDVEMGASVTGTITGTVTTVTLTLPFLPHSTFQAKPVAMQIAYSGATAARIGTGTLVSSTGLINSRTYNLADWPTGDAIIRPTGLYRVA